jgi:hypothetical protein
MGLFDQLAESGVVEAPKPDGAGTSLARQLVADQGLTPTAFDPNSSEPIPDVPEVRFRGAAVGPSEDLTRILKLPRRTIRVTDDESAAKKWTEILRRKRTPAEGPCDCVERWGFCIEKLRPVQGWALEEFAQVGGIVGPVGVGHGKEGICILTPMAALISGRIKAGDACMLLLQANLKAQLLQRDLPQWGAHFAVPNLAGGRFHTPGRPVLHVVSFHDLQSPRNADIGERTNPRIVIVNESQNVANRDGPRGKRFVRLFARNTRVHLAAFSGTFTKQSLTDYAHIAAFALQDGSPLPIAPPVVDEWAAALDATETPAPLGQLHKLCNPGESGRDGFRRRLHETPGVVATTEGSLDTLLTLREFKFGEPPETIKALLRDVRELWQRPDGEELVDALQKSAVCRQLASGFFLRWRFPRGETKEQIETWLLARKFFHKELREALKYRSRIGMDSPFLLIQAAIRWHDGYTFVDPNGGHQHTTACYELRRDEYGAPYDHVVCRVPEGDRRFIPPQTKNGPRPVWDSLTWPEWKRVKESVEPVTQAVFVDDYFARACADWAKQQTGIVWYDSDAFGRWVAKLGGLPFYGPGQDASAKILGEKGTRSIVASYRAHGTGKNLQVFAHNLIAQVPSDGAQLEQLIARTHRPGQRAQEVTAAFPRHTDEVRDAFEAARGKARYIQETMGTPQKILYAACEFENELRSAADAQVLASLLARDEEDEQIVE